MDYHNSNDGDGDDDEDDDGIATTTMWKSIIIPISECNPMGKPILVPH